MDSIELGSCRLRDWFTADERMKNDFFPFFPFIDFDRCFSFSSVPFLRLFVGISSNGFFRKRETPLEKISFHTVIVIYTALFDRITRLSIQQFVSSRRMYLQMFEFICNERISFSSKFKISFRKSDTRIIQSFQSGDCRSFHRFFLIGFSERSSFSKLKFSISLWIFAITFSIFCKIQCFFSMQTVLVADFLSWNAKSKLLARCPRNS